MLGMLCVALLMCSLPVSAAVNDVCKQHNYVSYTIYLSSKYEDNTNHTSTYEQGLRCSRCYTVLAGSFTNVKVLEIHLPSGTYTDLGHSGTGIHRFNVWCPKCKQYYILGIACNGDATGRHVYPY